MKFQLGGDALPPPLAYIYAPSEENKKGVCKFSAKFLAFSSKISTVQKIVLSSSRGKGNFRGHEASRPRLRTSKCVLDDVFEAKDVLEDSTSVNKLRGFIGVSIFRENVLSNKLRLLWFFIKHCTGDWRGQGQRMHIGYLQQSYYCLLN